MSDMYFVFENKYFGNQGYMVRYEELAPSGHEPLFRFLFYDLITFRSLVVDYTCRLVVEGMEGEPDEEDRLYREAENIHSFFKNRKNARELILRSILECAQEMDSVQDAINALSVSPAFSQEEHYWTMEAENNHLYRGSIYSLQKTQDRILTTITALLDESVPVLSTMTKEDREAVYTALFGQDKRHDEIPLTIGLMHSTSRKAELLQAWADSLPKKHRRSIDRLKGFISDDFHSRWMHVLNSVRDEEAPSVILAYKVHTLEDILEMELYDMLRENTRIGRCKECGRFFVIDPENLEFCTIEEDGKNCLRTYRESVTKDMYLKAYKTHNQRLSRGRCTREEFNDWKAEASAAREKVLQRCISMADYQKILKK